MAHFPGFGISGYRSLHGDPQWLPLGDDVTVILGANNSGKSNVLRLLHLHLADLFASVKSRAKDSALSSFTVRLDAPRTSDEKRLRVHWPIDLDAITSSGVRPEHLEALASIPSMSGFGSFTLGLSAPSLGGKLEVTLDDALAVMDETNRVPWGDLSNKFTNQQGGGHGEDAQRVLNWLRKHALDPPETVFVPPSRTIRAGSPTKEWDFGGDGVVDKLNRILNPEHDEDRLREQARALTSDLRTLLEDEDLELGVPHEQTTITIKLGGEHFPLESLGTGTEHAVLILAARHVYPDRLMCLEEPDAHLHPRMQRRLMDLLREPGRRRIVVATHSAHLIDLNSDTVLAARQTAGRTSVTRIGDPELFKQLRSLGYRASDLLQANAVIWVEGPSDRIYLLHWIRAVDPGLVEGFDFSIAFYGGALLRRLSGAADGPTDPTLVDLWRINQRMWLLMDSDRGLSARGLQDLKPAVERLQDEIACAGRGGTWITAGYTIENYVPHAILLEAASEVHPSVVAIDTPHKNRDPLAHLKRSNGTVLKSVDKVGVAMAVTQRPANLSVHDLRERIQALVNFISDTSAQSAVDG